MKIFIPVLTAFLLVSFSASAYVDLSNKEYDNIGLVDREIRRQDSNFLGFEGKKNKMRILGSVSEVQVQIYIDAMDIDALIADDPDRVWKQALVDDLRNNAKLSNTTIEYLTGIDATQFP